MKPVSPTQFDCGQASTYSFQSTKSEYSLDGPVPSFSTKGVSLLSAGLRSGATFVVALGAAGILGQFTHAPPIFLAVIASLVVAGMAFAFNAQDPFDADYATLAQISAHLVSSLAAIAGLLVIVNLMPAVGSFVCEPLVPWRFSIAIFGAFGMNWLSAAAAIQSPNYRAGLMIHLAFFWIAPFYGFFHGPWFLAQSVVLPCDGRPLAQAIIIALGMVVATIAGRRSAIWMFR